MTHIGLSRKQIAWTTKEVYNEHIENIDLASMHQTLQLMVIWVGLCLNKDSGFVLLGTGVN